MSWSVRSLGAADNAELLALSSTQSTGSSRFRVDRGPDFLALGRWLGRSSYHGVFDGASLIASLGVTRQVRFLRGEPTPVHYVHDLRVHPRYAGSRALLRLLEHAREAHALDAPWFVSTLLAENQRATRLLGRSRFVPAARAIGSTRHLGLPLFLPQLGGAAGVVELDARTAWRRYVELAERRDFAPADRARFVDGALAFLGVVSAGGLRAICSVVDQEAARRIVAARALGPLERLAAWICRISGRSAPPCRGRPLRFVYLSHCVAEAPLALGDAARRFAAFWSRRAAAYSHAFVGLPAEQAGCARLFEASLASTTYALGAAPSDLSLGFHELSLI